MNNEMNYEEILEGVNEAMKRHAEIVNERQESYLKSIQDVHQAHRELAARMNPTVRELAAIAFYPLYQGQGTSAYRAEMACFDADALILELAK